MIATYADFTKESNKVMADTTHRNRIGAYNKNYWKAFKETSQHFNNLELARKRAARLRWNIINHLDKYLIDGDQLMKSRDYHIARRKYYNADSIYRNFLEKDPANKALGDSIKRKLWVSDSLNPLKSNK